MLSAIGKASDDAVWEARNNQKENEIRDSRRNVEINVGKACNNRCVFCMDGLPKQEDRSYMPIEEMQAEIERWAASGHQSLGFLGGEPTTYPWLPQAIRYAKTAALPALLSPRTPPNYGSNTIRISCWTPALPEPRSQCMATRGLLRTSSLAYRKSTKKKVKSPALPRRQKTTGLPSGWALRQHRTKRVELQISAKDAQVFLHGYRPR